MIGSQIAGLGIAVPDRSVPNAEYGPRSGVSEQWIVERTGIHTRRVAADGETTSVLGARAASDALADAGIDAADVDMILCATVTPDWRFPAAASLIQHAIGASAPAFDLNAGCSGFLYALAQADAFVRAGSAATVLVVGAEVLSRITDYSDPKTAALFGDGAGAVVVTRCDAATRLGPFQLFSDGSRPELLYVPNETDVIAMQGREVYRAAVDGMSRAIAGVTSASGVPLESVDLVVAHQANQRILDAVGARLGVGPDVLFSNISRYGNTSAASIPLALNDARAEGRLEDDDLVVLAAFGAGFTWGAALLRWGIERLQSETTVATAGVAHG